MLLTVSFYSCDDLVEDSPPLGPPPPPPPYAKPLNPALSDVYQVMQRLKMQYGYSAQSTDGVDFAISTSGTTVRATITYADQKLLPLNIRDAEHKTTTITRLVDGLTVPTTKEYKDNDGNLQKIIRSHYVPQP